MKYTQDSELWHQKLVSQAIPQEKAQKDFSRVRAYRLGAEGYAKGYPKLKPPDQFTWWDDMPYYRQGWIDARDKSLANQHNLALDV